MTLPHEITSIDHRLLEENPADVRDCIKSRDKIIAELIEHETRLPKGISIFSCGYISAHDPHVWLEIHIGKSKYIWDQSQQKIPKSLLPLAEASQHWSSYLSPNQRMKIIPTRHE